MSSLLRIVLHADGTPNLAVIVPTVAVAVVLGGIVFARLRSRFGSPEPVDASDWAHAAYSIWTGGEDCGDWDRGRARESLASWYGITDARSFWGTIEGLRSGQTGSIAWDQVRAIDLLRIGSAAGFISDDECWRMVSSVAETLGRRYASWSAVAADFEAGMHAWQDERNVRDPQQRDRVQRNLPYLRETAWPRAAFKAPLEL